MKRHTLTLLTAVSALAATAQLSAPGVDIISVDVPSSLGYNRAFVVPSSGGLTLTYTAAATVTALERFSSLGAAYAEPVPFTAEGNNVTFTGEARDLGYRITTAGGATSYFWLVDYASHRYSVSGIVPDPTAGDCSRILLTVDGQADAITIYGINGRPETLDRDIRLDYRSLIYDADAETYRESTVTETYKQLSGHISAPAPLCDTQFTLQPDRFARQWRLADAVSTGTVEATAVEARTTAEQTIESSDNEQKAEAPDGSLGGSAPCEITFKAVVTDAAIYRRWEISTMPEFEDVTYTYDQLDFTYTFTEAGTVYVRFTANNAAGTCEYLGDTYTVSIGTSSLLCPNAFSPGSSEGVNDEWKVSYRSIVDFDCQIFNRWGKKLATLTHPSQGWDGIVGGKPVSSGVYFYVIKARGADGKVYNLSGDINVISSRRNNNLPSAPTE
ncbi:MAG: gliding motility-associated C-terminal domain-containing protein [Bacteroidales bacterium]|nr:gliding motility-associated C-terminal domain-containing protein [Bacteroidales bacterium]